LELSARNQRRGTITAVKPGGIMAEVTLDVGGQEVVAAITRGSVERLEPAVIKATEVLIAKP